MIKNAVGKILLDDATMAGYVADQIFPIAAPDETSFPFVVIQTNNTDPTDTKSGVSTNDQVSFQIDAYSTNVTELNNIMSRVRTLIDRYTGTESGLTIRNIFFVNESDGPFDIGAEIYAKSQDYRAHIYRG